MPTREGWLYLAALSDLASRHLEAWSRNECLAAVLTLAAHDLALAARQSAPGLLHHSDQGSQYASSGHRRKLRQRGVKARMSRRGHCYDNAPSEAFLWSFESEWMPERGFETQARTRAEIFEYVGVIYNRKRRHSWIGGSGPARYELRLRDHSI